MSAVVERNREKTEGRIIDAVEKILASEGYQALGVNRVAREAGVGKVLIYRYFGGIEGLLDAYGKTERFWPSAEEIRGMSDEDFGRLERPEQVRQIFRGFRQALKKRPHTIAIYAWEMAEKRDISQQLVARRTQNSLKLIRQMMNHGFLGGAPGSSPENESGAPEKQGSGERKEAGGSIPYEAEVAALLSAGLLHLTIREHFSAPFAGLPLQDEAVWERLECAVGEIFSKSS